MLDSFKNFIEKYTVLPDNEWEIIKQVCEKKEFSKNEVFLKEGNVCRYFYFLETGLIRFFIYKDGNEITKMFTAAPNCFTSTSSFRNQVPANENLQSIERSVVWQIPCSKLEVLSKLNSWNTFIRKFVNEVQEFTEDFLMEVRTETAEERYKKLLNKYSDVVLRIPLKYLSSFLGIAPQSLSRIRKRMHKGLRN